MQCRLTCSLAAEPKCDPILDRLSVQLNVSEGQGLATPLLFRKHLTISYGSSIEAVDVIELLRELLPNEEKDLKELQDWGEECSRLILGLKHSIENRL